MFQINNPITMVSCFPQLHTDDLIEVVPVILRSTPGSPTIGRFTWGILKMVTGLQKVNSHHIHSVYTRPGLSVLAH